MRNTPTFAKISAALAFCLLTASCADFFNPKQNGTKDNGGNTPQGGGVLPEEFQKPNEGPFSEKKMLINIGKNILARSSANLSAQVPVLKNSLRQYCEALSTGAPSAREEAQAKSDWERTMLAFHELSAAPIGPLLDEGRALNDYIYSWPYLNTCTIDKNVWDNAQNPMSSGSLIFNVRGLSTIEYLLFEKSYISTCNVRANPAMKVWNERSLEDKKMDRCLWALELTQDLETKTNALNTKWAVDQGNFTKTLVDETRYKSLKEAINALTDNLAHIEILKDAKLGKPMARHKECLEEKCLDSIEHRYSGLSLAAAAAHLKGFRAIFTGSFSNQPDFGLDDLLIKSGRSDVAQKVIAATDKAIASILAADARGSLYDQLEAADSAACKATTMTDRKEEICAVHADVREVAFLLKTEVLAALALRAPPSHQGDND